MMIIKYIIALLLLLPVNGFGWQLTGSGVVTPAGPAINYYFNADSATSELPPTVGAGTVRVGSGCSTVTGAVGDALYCTGSWNEGSIGIPVESFMNTAVGTLGMYITPSVTAGYIAGITNRYTDTPFFLITHNAGVLDFRYASSIQTISGISDGVRNFVEFAWDLPNLTMAYRLNGASWVERTITGTEPTSTENMNFGAVSGNFMSADFDQILESNTYKADLYAVRNNTSF